MRHVRMSRVSAPTRVAVLATFFATLATMVACSSAPTVAPESSSSSPQPAMKSLYVNIPVADVARAKDFYIKLGATAKNLGASNDPQLTEKNTAYVVWAKNIEILLLSRDFFQTATHKRISDPTTTARVVLAFSATSRDEVDATMKAGLAAGGSEWNAVEDQEHMYARYLQDLDGNLLEFIYLDGS
jgi:predicted lactoylglutathione lyase